MLALIATANFIYIPTKNLFRRYEVGGWLAGCLENIPWRQTVARLLLCRKKREHALLVGTVCPWML